LGLATVRTSPRGAALLLLPAMLVLVAFMGGPLALAIASIVALGGWFLRPTSSPATSGESLPGRVLTAG
jgi:hypothetical protein